MLPGVASAWKVSVAADAHSPSCPALNRTFVASRLMIRCPTSPAATTVAGITPAGRTNSMAMKTPSSSVNPWMPALRWNRNGNAEAAAAVTASTASRPASTPAVGSSTATATTASTPPRATRAT